MIDWPKIVYQNPYLNTMDLEIYYPHLHYGFRIVLHTKHIPIGTLCTMDLESDYAASSSYRRISVCLRKDTEDSLDNTYWCQWTRYHPVSISDEEFKLYETPLTLIGQTNPCENLISWPLESKTLRGSTICGLNRRRTVEAQVLMMSPL